MLLHRPYSERSGGDFLSVSSKEARQLDGAATGQTNLTLYNKWFRWIAPNAAGEWFQGEPP